MKYRRVRDTGGTQVIRPRGDHPYDEDMVFCPQLIVDDIVPEDTGLVDHEGNRIVKVHEWGFHQDHQPASPYDGPETQFP